jgi:hypothetical protein
MNITSDLLTTHGLALYVLTMGVAIGAIVWGAWK